jgi:phage gpG-like protein
MINVEITGNLPNINTDLEPAMEKIADIMYRSVQQNFISGGRPNQWEPLAHLGLPSHLYQYQSGFMFENIQLSWDGTQAKVFIDTARVPYARINNFGGVIKHPGSDKFQAFAGADGMVFTHGTKPHDINIPQRKFMMFQEMDKIKILQTLSNVIFIESGEKI